MLELDFKPSKDSTGSGLFLAWTRPRKGKKFETVAWKADKWGWDPWRGSSVEVFMTRSRNRGNIALCRESATMWDLLATDEKRKMQVVQNAVVAKCRVPTEDEYNAHLGFKAYTPSGMRVYREACEPVDLSRHQPQGLLLRFVDADDLKTWWPAIISTTWRRKPPDGQELLHALPCRRLGSGRRSELPSGFCSETLIQWRLVQGGPVTRHPSR